MSSTADADADHQRRFRSLLHHVITCLRSYRPPPRITSSSVSDPSGSSSGSSSSSEHRPPADVYSGRTVDPAVHLERYLEEHPVFPVVSAGSSTSSATIASNTASKSQSSSIKNSAGTGESLTTSQSSSSWLEADRLFLRETFLGVERYRPVLERVLHVFYSIHRTALPSDALLYLTVLYWALCRLDDLRPTTLTDDILAAQPPATVHTILPLLAFVFDNEQRSTVDEDEDVDDAGTGADAGPDSGDGSGGGDGGGDRSKPRNGKRKSSIGGRDSNKGAVQNDGTSEGDDDDDDVEDAEDDDVHVDSRMLIRSAWLSAYDAEFVDKSILGSLDRHRSAIQLFLRRQGFRSHHGRSTSTATGKPLPAVANSKSRNPADAAADSSKSGSTPVKMKGSTGISDEVGSKNKPTTKPVGTASTLTATAAGTTKSSTTQQKPFALTAPKVKRIPLPAPVVSSPVKKAAGAGSTAADQAYTRGKSLKSKTGAVMGGGAAGGGSAEDVVDWKVGDPFADGTTDDANNDNLATDGNGDEDSDRLMKSLGVSSKFVGSSPTKSTGSSASKQSGTSGAGNRQSTMKKRIGVNAASSDDQNDEDEGEDDDDDRKQSSPVGASAKNGGVRPLPASLTIDPPSIRLTAAAILREDAMYQRQLEREAQLLEQYEAQLRDGADFARWQAAMRAEDAAAIAAAVEERRVSLRALERELQQLRAKRLETAREAAVKARDMERDRWLQRQAGEKAEMEELQRKAALDRQTNKESVMAARSSLAAEREKQARRVKREAERLLQQRAEEEERERKRKEEVVLGIRAETSIPGAAARLLDDAVGAGGGSVNGSLVGMRNFDPTESSGVGLLVEMSHAELQERLVETKQQRQTEEQERRLAIRNAKQAREAELARKLERIGRMRSGAKQVGNSRRTEEQVQAATERVQKDAVRAEAVKSTAQRLQQRVRTREEERAAVTQVERENQFRRQFLAADSAAVEAKRFGQVEAGAERAVMQRQTEMATASRKERERTEKDKLQRTAERSRTDRTRQAVRGAVDAAVAQDARAMVEAEGTLLAQRKSTISTLRNGGPSTPSSSGAASSKRVSTGGDLDLDLGGGSDSDSDVLAAMERDLVWNQ